MQRYPWKYQIVCLILTAGLIVVAFLLPQSGLYFNTRHIDLSVSFTFLAIILGAIIALLPLRSFRRLKRQSREQLNICHRCERPLPPECELAQYGGEFVCLDCAAKLEEIERRPLPRVRVCREKH